MQRVGSLSGTASSMPKPNSAGHARSAYAAACRNSAAMWADFGSWRAEIATVNMAMAVEADRLSVIYVEGFGWIEPHGADMMRVNVRGGQATMLANSFFHD